MSPSKLVYTPLMLLCYTLSLHLAVVHCVMCSMCSCCAVVLYTCLFQHKTSRANWTSENTQIFCDIYCMQLDLGQCVRGSMSKWGWKDVAERYYAATGLVHDNEQFSSRVRQLRAMWHFINDLLSC